MAGTDQHLYSVLERAPMMAWVTGLDARCTFVNAAWLAFTGRTVEAELGDGWTEIIHADDTEQARATYREAFDAREPFRMEYRARRHDGRQRIVLDFGVQLTSI